MKFTPEGHCNTVIPHVCFKESYKQFNSTIIVPVASMYCNVVVFNDLLLCVAHYLLGLIVHSTQRLPNVDMYLISIEVHHVF